MNKVIIKKQNLMMALVEVDQRLTLYFENGVLARIDDATLPTFHLAK